MNFPVLNLPDASLRFENREGKPFVFDIIRKKYVALQPEEWVRQHLIHYLIDHRAYPKSMLRIEGGMHYNKLQKRTDLLVYDRNLRPFLLLECKAPDVKLSNKSIEQLSVYNQNYQARYLALSNGLDHKIFEMDYKQRKFMPLSEYPVFQL
ncbi:MAG: type I restriction enzyme HsdR N-terminal domain-containing protein [Cyclobacteriaceae bacterium]|nr:type I restriction enzyme HsdR N-terminal domain-containing protein [Cyclobacteriaceae bacterium]